MPSTIASYDYSAVRPRGFSRIAALVDPQDRLRRILADKSTLVYVRLLPRDHWASRDDRPLCVFCGAKFRTFSRKVHCRGCGEVVCSACYRKRDVQVGPSPSDTLPVRLCFDCIDHALSPPPPLLEEHDEMGDGIEGSFTNSGRVTLSACSSHMKFVDGLLVETTMVGAATGTAISMTDSFVNLELSHYEDDSDAGDDTDRESAYGYDSDGDNDETYYQPPANKTGRSHSSTSTVSSSGSASNSSSGSSGPRALGFVPEDESLGDFVSDMKLTLSDLDVDMETQRRDLLQQLHLASLDRQQEFDALCELVSRALHCGVAAVGFLCESVQWYKAKIGISQAQLPREVAFCSQLLEEHSATVVLDATKDPRFCLNPLVTGSAHIRFYASMPICDPASGIVLGSVFVMDPQPKKKLPPRAMDLLAYASRAAQQLLDFDATSSHKRHSHQKKMCRVLSTPRLVVSRTNEPGDRKQFSKSDGARGSGGAALWTTEPPAKRSASSHSQRSRSSCSGGIQLLDSESFTSLTSKSRRGSVTSDGDGDSVDVLGRSAPPRMATIATTKPPAFGEEIRLQIEATRQMLSSLGPSPRRTASRVATEVEV